MPDRARSSTSTRSSPGRPAGGLARGAAPGLGAPRRRAAARAPPGCCRSRAAMSNALLVSAKDSASGHPLVVVGPQVAYFSPQILMEEDIHGPGIDADGAAVPGGQHVRRARPRPRLRVVGHLRRAEHHRHVRGAALQPGGGAVAPSSDYYLLQGHCVQMETLTGPRAGRPTRATRRRRSSRSRRCGPPTGS